MAKKLLAIALPAVLVLSACGSATAEVEIPEVAVAAKSTGCQIATTEFAAGSLSFTIANEGTEDVEFAVLGPDQKTVLSQIPVIAPGTTKELVVDLAAGDYFVACGPGGAAVQAITVSGAPTPAPTPTDAEAIAKVEMDFQRWVKSQTEELLTETEKFAKNFKSGDFEAAKTDFQKAAEFRHALRAVIDSFGDPSLRVDLAESEVPTGEEWTGWRRVELDLWQPEKGYTPLTKPERKALAKELVTDTKSLITLLDSVQFQEFQIVNAANQLVAQVAAGLASDETEVGPGTRLAEYSAKLSAAYQSYTSLREVLFGRNPDLARALNDDFDVAMRTVDSYQQEDGFVPFANLADQAITDMQKALVPLSDSLTKLAASLVG